VLWRTVLGFFSGMRGFGGLFGGFRRLPGGLRHLTHVDTSRASRSPLAPCGLSEYLPPQTAAMMSKPIRGPRCNTFRSGGNVFDHTVQIVFHAVQGNHRFATSSRKEL